MGLDISIIEYKGKDNKGYLITKSADLDNWDDTRMTIRKEILKNVEFESLSSGIYYDLEECYRITNFPKAHEWAETLEEKDKKYIKNILEILQSNDNYYLEYGY